MTRDARPQQHSRSLRLLAIGLVLALIVLVYSLVEIRGSGKGTVAQATLLRPARVLVSQALAYQYEQATDVRDYVDLRQRSFLSRYAAAGNELDRALDNLDATLASAQVADAVAPARDARQKLRQWRFEVAAPLLARPQSTATRALELRGAALVDGFRDDIMRVSDVISRRFDSIRDNQITLLRRFSLVAGGIVLLLVVAVAAPLVVRLLGLPGPDVQNARLTDSFGSPLGPSLAHPFGVDQLGQDVMSRVI